MTRLTAAHGSRYVHARIVQLLSVHNEEFNVCVKPTKTLNDKRFFLLTETSIRPLGSSLKHWVIKIANLFQNCQNCAYLSENP